MPSPIGHFIAGASVALATDQRHELTRRWRHAVLVCALLGASPDLDLLYPGAHRTMTHSLPAVLLALLAAMAVTFRRGGRVDWRMSVTCALAYGTHVLTDYLGADPGKAPGVPLLWPWDREPFLSDWTIFLATERHYPFSAFAMSVNAMALARESLVLGPIFLVLLLRRRRLGRVGTTDVPAARQSTEATR